MAEDNGNTTGQLLRREREKKKRTIEQAHEETKISINVLRALEEDDVTAFPSDTYHKGFLKNYASWLGLDGNRLWGQHTRRSEGAADAGGTFWDIEETIREEKLGPSHLYRRLVLPILLIAIIILVVLLVRANRKVKDLTTGSAAVHVEDVVTGDARQI
jgi:cytoskeleton protein RodZ